MKKRLQKLSEVLKRYTDTPQFGALFLPPLYKSELLKSDNSFTNLPSSKDCYFLLDRNECVSLASNQEHVYSFNGVSSLVYFDRNINTILQDSLTPSTCKITLISPHESCQTLLGNFDLLYDDIIPVKESIAATELIRIYKNRSASTIFKKKAYKEVIILSGFTVNQTYIYAQHLYANIIGSIVICPKSYHFSPSQSVENQLSDIYVEDSSSILPENLSPAENYYKTPLYMGAITAIINLYKRYSSVEEIYNQLLSQTYPVSSIYIWFNSAIDNSLIAQLREKLPKAKFILSDENLGVWARFAFALNCRTEYTVIFDDDTLPGKKWIHNCVQCMEKQEALYGTVGLIYNSNSCYMDHTRYGWPSANHTSVAVDIVGHSWFFKTKWLRYYWNEFEPSSGNEFCGEDMHFSYALQKHGIPTMVPPHPIFDRELWGSTKAVELGTGSEAISVSGKGSHMDIPFRRLIERGFKLIKDI